MIVVGKPFVADPRTESAPVVESRCDGRYIRFQFAPDQEAEIDLDSPGDPSPIGSLRGATGPDYGLGRAAGVAIHCISNRCMDRRRGSFRPPIVARVVTLTDPSITVVVSPEAAKISAWHKGLEPQEAREAQGALEAELARRRPGQYVGDLLEARQGRRARADQGTQGYRIDALPTTVTCHRCRVVAAIELHSTAE